MPALDQASQDTQEHSKINYFLLSCPSHSGSYKKNGSPSILTEDLERTCSISKPDDTRCWILPFDTFPVEKCWFPSPKCFWINFMYSWGPLQGWAAHLFLHWWYSSVLAVVNHGEKHNGLSLVDQGCMTLGPGLSINQTLPSRKYISKHNPLWISVRLERQDLSPLNYGNLQSRRLQLS